MFSIIKPRGDIKTNWESVNPVLRLREWGIEWEETVGTGDIKVKIGDGVKHWNELDYAIVNDVTKKIVKTFAEVNSDDNPNPILNPGESIDALFGKIKQKFEYATNFMTSLKNMVGDYQARSFNTGSGTVTADDLKSAIDILEQYKLTTANILDVNDSTNTFAALSANQGRLINEKAVANANAISTLNSNLSNTNQNLSNIDSALVSVSKVTNRAAESMPDNTDYNSILQPGWYDIYSTDISKTHAPASGLGRVLLRVESILLGGSIWITTQEAIEWYGIIALNNPRIWKRWTYSQNGVLVWINWKEL